jgi:hypothetical protein
MGQNSPNLVTLVCLGTQNMNFGHTMSYETVRIRVARFFLGTNTGKIYQMTTIYTNFHKIYQIRVK